MSLRIEVLGRQHRGLLEDFGFTRLADEFPCRMVLDLKPLLDQ